MSRSYSTLYLFTITIANVLYAITHGRTVYLGILAPSSGSRSLGSAGIHITMELAFEKVNGSPELTHLRTHNVTIEYLVADTECDIGTGLFELVQINDKVDAFIDVKCNEALHKVPENRRFRYGRQMNSELESLIPSGREFQSLGAAVAKLRSPNMTLRLLDTTRAAGTILGSQVLGPACDSLCLPAGRLAGKWNKAMISYSCSSRALNSRLQYPTFARTTAIYVEMTHFILDFIEYHKWNRVIIVEGPESIWRETAGVLQTEFEAAGIATGILSILPESTHEILEKNLKEASTEAHVFILCAYGKDVMFVICAAETSGLLQGEHAFISIDFAYMTKIQPKDRPCDIYKFLDGVLDVTIQLDEDYAGYKYFVRQLVDRIHGVHGPEIGIHYGMIYDAVYLYCVGMNAVLGKGGDTSNGTEIVNQLLHHSFQGITGTIQINENGTRRTNFTVHNIFHDTYTTIAHGNTSPGSLVFEDDVVIYWPGGSTKAPLGRPVCGWDNEFCTDNSEYTIVFTSVGMVSSLLISMTLGVAMFLYRKRKYQERMESMSWKICYSDLDFKAGAGVGSIYSSKATFLTKRSKSRDTVNDTRRANSMDSNLSGGVQLFTKIGTYRGKLLAIKHVNKPYLAVTKDLITEINQIRNLDHRNINPLVGACIEPLKTSILTVYCPKGSLQDVLENDTIKLDQIFKVSFATDIAKGMHYLHLTAVKSHGHFKSSNVFIDQHWTCRVGDITMPVFREGEKTSVDIAIRESYQALWTAPEILRESEIDPRGSQKGDVYSYGIILQEIMLRTGPYGYDNMDSEDILCRVKEKETPPFRPLVPAVEGIPEIDDVMRMTWEEVPLFRPTFGSILESLKKFNNGRTTNLVDQMVHMMEKYADHLEELVQERTELLELEQTRTEDLLCRMLPRSIANDLKVGKIIAPETYESVTVFFSDIVGFTALSSQSTAMEVVNFLNDLYTCFDTVIEDFDVYKVETIGDAYMVVSGVPVRNGNKHAGEIATMALELLSSVTTFKIRHRPNKQLQMRIGMHSGPVCAGVVGLKMPRYCLFGDTVNYASRMESTGLALRIHVSPECKSILEDLDGFHFECRGVVCLKGKGEIRTYYLLGRQGFCKPLPDLTLALPPDQHTVA